MYRPKELSIQLDAKVINCPRQIIMLQHRCDICLLLPHKHQHVQSFHFNMGLLFWRLRSLASFETTENRIQICQVPAPAPGSSM